MSDHFDFGTGAILYGNTGIAEAAEALLESAFDAAGGAAVIDAESLRQDNFISWKRGVSL